MKKIASIICIALITTVLCAENRVVIYHDSYAMISESLSISLEQGVNIYRYEDIATGIDFNTVMLLPSDNSFTVSNQSFVNRIIGDLSFIRGGGGSVDFLRLFLNKEIDIVMKDGNSLKGKLLFLDPKVIIMTDRRGRYLHFNTEEVRNYNLPQLEDELIINPFLQWEVLAERKGVFPAQIIYLCRGFSWNGLYRGIWDGEELTLNIMATISNTSNKDLDNFSIQLIAGEPNRVRPSRSGDFFSARILGERVSGSGDGSAGPGGPVFTADDVQGFQLFTYSEKVSINRNETQQIQLYQQRKLNPEVYYEYKTESDYVSTKLKLVNDEDSNLGFLLPRGRVQIYTSKDSKLIFTGEDHVSQTPVNEEWIITPGKATDIVANTIIRPEKVISENLYERDVEVSVRNRSSKKAKIDVVHIQGRNWEITDSSHEYQTEKTNYPVFEIELDAGEEVSILWTEKKEAAVIRVNRW